MRMFIFNPLRAAAPPKSSTLPRRRLFHQGGGGGGDRADMNLTLRLPARHAAGVTLSSQNESVRILPPKCLLTSFDIF